MSNLRKWLIVVLSVMVTVLCGIAITACNSNSNWRVPKGGLVNDSGYTPSEPKKDDYFYHEGEDPNDFLNDENCYVVKTVSLGGMAVSGVTVKVINPVIGDTLIEGLTVQGVVKFNIAPSNYTLEYDLPEGYYESDQTVHSLTPDNLSVTTVFSSKIIDSAVPGDHNYMPGEVMYDFEVADADGATRKLSELLTTRKAIVLNFFFTSCGPCKSEFPALEQAYKEYRNDVEVIALSDRDSNTAVKGFKVAGNYSFFMAADSLNLYVRFQVSNFPTTIIVDRYGVIAARHEGSQPSPDWWRALFLQFTDDNYQQHIEETTGGESESRPVAPGADIDPLPDNSTLNNALLHESMSTDLKFYEPEAGSNDALFNWPYHVGQDSDGSEYLTPANVSVNNSWAILYTDITIGRDEYLTIEVNNNTEENGDVLYIIINRLPEYTVSISGNSNGWKKYTLYSATRTTLLNVSFLYQKSLSISVENEFVGIRNLRIEQINTDTDEALDVRTEASVEQDGVMVYQDIYLSNTDNFYHVKTGEAQAADDPILFTDILTNSFYSERHMKGYNLINDSGQTIPLSLYNICYWRFNDYETSGVNIKLTDDDNTNNKYTETIIDCFYIQDGSTAAAPVTEEVKDILKAFVQAVHDRRGMLGSSTFEDTAELTDNTWLELCHYYRTLGKGDHKNKDHICLATTNMGAGRTMTYAIELKQDVRYSIDTSEATRKNRLGGLFYKFTAPEDGAYSFKSFGPNNLDQFDPKIAIWPAGADPFNDSMILEMDDSLSVTDAIIPDSYITDFNAIIYLHKGETIYPQITTQSVELTGTYDVEITWLGSDHHELEIASTGGGLWTYDEDDPTEIFYMAVDTALNTRDNNYYHLNNGQYCSLMYIDFIHRNLFDQNGHSIKYMIDNGYFDFTNQGGGNFTGRMNEYYEKAISKDPKDPTYGMTEATQELVQIISSFTSINLDSGSDIESGIWKAFACYYHYYGPTSWKPVPVN